MKSLLCKMATGARGGFQMVKGAQGELLEFLKKYYSLETLQHLHERQILLSSATIRDEIMKVSGENFTITEVECSCQGIAVEVALEKARAKMAS